MPPIPKLTQLLQAILEPELYGGDGPFELHSNECLMHGHFVTQMRFGSRLRSP